MLEYRDFLRYGKLLIFGSKNGGKAMEESAGGIKSWGLEEPGELPGFQDVGK